MEMTYTQLCGMPRLEKNSTAPKKKTRNTCDPYAVTVKKANLTVGHIPMKISALCSLFYSVEEPMRAVRVPDLKRYSSDLSHGKLKIHCILKFEGEKLLVGKV